MKVLPLEMQLLVKAASDVVIIDDNARRPKYSHTEAVEPVQLVHFGSSWMKFTSCPSKEKKRMQLHSLGASRLKSRWGGSTVQQSQSYSNLNLHSGANGDAAASRYNEEKPTVSTLRRITSDSSVVSSSSRHSAPTLPSRGFSPRKPQRRTSNCGPGEEGEGMGNATWGTMASGGARLGSTPHQADLMSRFHPSMLPRKLPLTGSSPIAKSSLTSRTDSFLLNSMGAEQDVKSMRHVASETAMSSKHAAPRLPSRKGFDSSSSLGLKMPQRRGSEAVGNATWGTESSASTSGSYAPMESAGLRTAQSMSMLSSIQGSSQFSGNDSLMKKMHPSMMPGSARNPLMKNMHPSMMPGSGNNPLMRNMHPSMMPGGMRTHASNTQKQANMFSKHKDSFILNSVAAHHPLCESSTDMTDMNYGALEMPQRRSSGMSNASWESGTSTKSNASWDSDASSPVRPGGALMSRLNATMPGRGVLSGMNRSSPKGLNSMVSGTNNGMNSMLNGNSMNRGMNSMLIGSTTKNGMNSMLNRSRPNQQDQGMLVKGANSEMDKGVGIKSGTAMGPYDPQLRRTTSDEGPTPLRRQEAPGSRVSSIGVNIPQRRASVEEPDESVRTSMKGYAKPIGSNMPDSYLSALAIIAEKSKKYDSSSKHGVNPLDAVSSPNASTLLLDDPLSKPGVHPLDAVLSPNASAHPLDDPLSKDSVRPLHFSSANASAHPLDGPLSKASIHPIDELSKVGDRRLLMKRSASATKMRKPERRLSNDKNERPKFERMYSEPVLNAEKEEKMRSLQNSQMKFSIPKKSAMKQPIPKKSSMKQPNQQLISPKKSPKHNRTGSLATVEEKRFEFDTSHADFDDLDLIATPDTSEHQTEHEHPTERLSPTIVKNLPKLDGIFDERGPKSAPTNLIPPQKWPTKCKPERRPSLEEQELISSEPNIDLAHGKMMSTPKSPTKPKQERIAHAEERERPKVKRVSSLPVLKIEREEKTLKSPMKRMSRKTSFNGIVSAMSGRKKGMARTSDMEDSSSCEERDTPKVNRVPSLPVLKGEKEEKMQAPENTRKRMSRKKSFNGIISVLNGRRKGVIRTRSMEASSSRASASAVSVVVPPNGSIVSPLGLCEAIEECEVKKRRSPRNKVVGSFGIGKLRKRLSRPVGNPQEATKDVSRSVAPVSNLPESPRKPNKMVSQPATAVTNTPESPWKVTKTHLQLVSQVEARKTVFPRRYSLGTAQWKFPTVSQEPRKRRNSMDHISKCKGSMNMIELLDQELSRQMKTIHTLSKTVKSKEPAEREDIRDAIDGHRRRNTFSTMPIVSIKKSTARRRNSLDGILIESFRSDLGDFLVPASGPCPSPRSTLKFSLQEGKSPTNGLEGVKFPL
jgi:hypothetical protein